MSWLKPRNANGNYTVDDNTSAGYRLLLGNQTWTHWSIEGFYVDTGKAGISSSNSTVGHLGDVSYKAYGLGTEWTPFKDSRAATLYPLLKAGVVSTNNSASDSRIQYQKLHSLGVYFGAAGVWKFADTWRAQLEITSYDKDEFMASLGIRKTFGGHRQAAFTPPPPDAAPVKQSPQKPSPIANVVSLPAAVDSDHDGVTDDKDLCPNTLAGDKVDRQGCSLTIRLQVHFDNNSGNIKSDSYAELDQLIAFMKKVPTVTGELQGYTDDVGGELSNLKLSQLRADSIKAYMVSKGIADDRLLAIGYGESAAVADNATAEGRAQNRRVLFVRTDVK